MTDVWMMDVAEYPVSAEVLLEEDSHTYSAQSSTAKSRNGRVFYANNCALISSSISCPSIAMLDMWVLNISPLL